MSPRFFSLAAGAGLPAFHALPPCRGSSRGYRSTRRRGGRFGPPAPADADRATPGHRTGRTARRTVGNDQASASTPNSIAGLKTRLNTLGGIFEKMQTVSGALALHRRPRLGPGTPTEAVWR